MANETKFTPAEQRVKDYLDQYAAQDPVFAIKYMTGGKTLNGCVAYITKQAKEAAKSGRTYFADDQEVFGWAVHYFDEDSLNEEKSAAVAKVETNSPADDTDEADETTTAPTTKTAKPKTTKPRKAATPKPAAPATSQIATVPEASTEGDDEVIDLFAGLFD